MENQKTFYITTPIYYPSDKLHIGHSYTTVAADAVARYKKLRGYDVRFLTGTDEHGQKIEQKAKEAGVTPKEYVDKIVDWIKDLWKTMNIEYDYFIRTTDKEHEACVQKIFKKLYETGDIYKKEYIGKYCVPCESFFTEHQLVDGKCPDCGRDVNLVSEEAYFFRLSKYQDALIKHIEDNPEFIQPVTRRNEMVNNFLKPGLEDVCVSRTTFKWGIPVDFDPGHVVYVWIDALSSYISKLGFLSENGGDYSCFWPADVHLVGKEIVRFHTIIWPALLMALDIPLPKQVFGHGWLIIDGGKMSKSKNNVIDPSILVERYGVDAVRYFLLREVAFGQDGNYTHEALLTRINSDLSNDLGNLLSRTVGMIEKYFGGALPLDSVENAYDADIKALAKKTTEKTEQLMDKMLFSDALSEIWVLVRRANKYVDETKPWELNRDESKRAELAGVMYTLSEVLRIVSILIGPMMPDTPKRIWAQLGINDENTTAKITSWESASDFGLLPREIRTVPGAVMFPRYEIAKELEALGGTQFEVPENKTEKQEEPPKPSKPLKEAKKEFVKPAEIDITDFMKCDLRVGKVLECKPVEGSDKLLVSQISIGGEVRQIVSGIAKTYSPEQMTGKKVIVAVNLKPVKLRGVMSYGMILAAQDENGLNLLTVDGGVESGAVVS